MNRVCPQSRKTGSEAHSASRSDETSADAVYVAVLVLLTRRCEMKDTKLYRVLATSVAALTLVSTSQAWARGPVVNVRAPYWAGGTMAGSTAPVANFSHNPYRGEVMYNAARSAVGVGGFVSGMATANPWGAAGGAIGAGYYGWQTMQAFGRYQNATTTNVIWVPYR